ncbi:hypothetical protein F0L74_15105 [Chitinophaga agrisoli]|uniref:Uncharacterized protein n=1 Tax=Chitinophaga agrisoli TaxID=2607653 RepID=A0A5B2VWV1_9BACT|nr:hypothetical protein [Chitinophaga agrisoli]KAA2243801.1 hypothetical protein F0L74_15105 [Chitinophaga agrisoli]
MSILGLIHTIIAIIALVFAANGLIKTGFVSPFSATGKWYSIMTVLACLTSFGLSKAGGFNPGHAIGILILVLLAIAYLIGKNASRKRILLYVQVFAMTATVFLSLIPAVNETLSRVPAGAPLATGPDDPLVQNVVKVLLVLFIIGVTAQILKLRKTSLAAQQAA